MDTAKITVRSALRTAAMQLIYEHYSGGEGGDDSLVMIAEELQEEYQGQKIAITREKDKEYIDRIVQGVIDTQSQLDEKIASAAKGWTLDRISKVDLCILRLALWEIYNADDVPDNVSASEAVNLAKRYSDEGSGRFVNGILGTLVREKEENPQ